MSSTAAKRLGPAEYLARERVAETRSEFYDGEVFAMAGGTRNHSLIATNLMRAVGNALSGRPCRAYNSDLRVATPSGLFTYPDGSVVCGEDKFLDNRRDTLTNPVVLFEVLSPSTEAYDRGAKFEHYQQFESLRAYVLIAQDRPSVSVFVRGDDGEWSMTLRRAGEFDIPPLNISIQLADLYDQVELPPQQGGDHPLSPHAPQRG